MSTHLPLMPEIYRQESPHNPQVGRHVCSQDLSLSTARRTLKVLLFPYREICTHTNLSWDPLFTSGDRTSRLREVSGRALDSRIPETRQQSTLTFFLFPIGIFLSRFSALAMSNNLFPTPESRYAETPTHTALTFDFSTVPSPLHRDFGLRNIANPDAMFRDFSPRNPDKVCHLSTHLTPVAPHYPLACRDIAYRDFAIPVAIFLETSTHETPIHDPRVNPTALVAWINGSAPPEL
jgi:hypothetical protein